MSGIQRVAMRVPEQWNADWFRKFIVEVLAKSDVRNAVGLGVQVTSAGNSVATLSVDAGLAALAGLADGGGGDSELSMPGPPGPTGAVGPMGPAVLVMETGGGEDSGPPWVPSPGAAVADATDAASAITQLNALLASLRARSVIAT